MDKINFINQSTPALNATNLNKLQDNVEDAITEVQDDVDSLETNKLNKTDVKTAKTTSDTNTYSCTYINNAIIGTYSTAEQKTDIYWIDNKPIYRKVINYSTNLTSGINRITHNISNINEIVNVYGHTVGTTQYNLGTYESSTNFINICYVNNIEVAVQVGSGWGSSFSGCVIVLEYTKTTD